MATTAQPPARLSLRLDLPGGARIGPGKVALLAAIAEAGSIRGAAARLGMSYPRALKLIEEMNAALRTPVIAAKAGGPRGGGATLTGTGTRLVAAYQRLCDEAAAATAGTMAEITALVRTD